MTIRETTKKDDIPHLTGKVTHRHVGARNIDQPADVSQKMTWDQPIVLLGPVIQRRVAPDLPGRLAKRPSTVFIAWPWKASQGVLLRKKRVFQGPPGCHNCWRVDVQNSRPPTVTWLKHPKVGDFPSPTSSEIPSSRRATGLGQPPSCYLREIKGRGSQSRRIRKWVFFREPPPRKTNKQTNNCIPFGFPVNSL